MHDDIEYRLMLACALREAGASFDVIVEVLKARTRIAQQRERLQSSPQRIQELQIVASHRRDDAAGVQHTNVRHQPIGTIPISHASPLDLTRKATRETAIPAWLNGLDMRVAHALLRAGFQSAEEVREAIAEGKVIDRVKARRLSMIEAWLQAAQ